MRFHAAPPCADAGERKDGLAWGGRAATTLALAVWRAAAPAAAKQEGDPPVFLCSGHFQNVHRR
jgi:hypothetical protein